MRAGLGMTEKIDNPFRGLLRLEKATHRVLTQVCAELDRRGFDLADVGELALLGVIGDGCSMTDIRVNGWDLEQNISRTASKLSQKSYVAISSGLDRRQRKMVLTDKGRAALAIAVPMAWELWEAERPTLGMLA